MSLVVGPVMGFLVCSLDCRRSVRRGSGSCGGRGCGGRGLCCRHRLRCRRLGQDTTGKRHTSYQQRSDRELSQHDFSLE